MAQYLNHSDSQGLWTFSSRLFKEAKEHEQEHGPELAALLRLLAAATSMRLADGGKPPFQPVAVWREEGKRSPTLDDFDVADVDALAAAAVTAPSAVVRARLSDVAATAGVELGAKQWRSSVLAVQAYLELAEEHLLSDAGISVLTEFIRGLRLARVYCRNDQEIHSRYWALAQKAITQSLQGDTPGIGCVLAEEVRRARRDLAEPMALELELAAQRYADRLDF